METNDYRKTISIDLNKTEIDATSKERINYHIRHNGKQERSSSPGCIKMTRGMAWDELEAYPEPIYESIMVYDDDQIEGKKGRRGNP